MDSEKSESLKGVGKSKLRGRNWEVRDYVSVAPIRCVDGIRHLEDQQWEQNTIYRVYREYLDISCVKEESVYMVEKLDKIII